MIHCGHVVTFPLLGMTWIAHIFRVTPSAVCGFPLFSTSLFAVRMMSGYPFLLRISIIGKRILALEVRYEFQDQ